jgi:hypothetical protein
MTSICQCGAQIQFIRSAEGRSFPVDVQYHRGVDITNAKAAKEAWEDAGYQVVRGFDSAGNTVTVAKAPPDYQGRWTEVRESHFATCPLKKRFERKR